MMALPVPLNQLEASKAAQASPIATPRPAKLPAANPTPSFWIDSPGANPLAQEGSTGPLTADADVCIIGSGITGVSAAYHLAKGLQRTRAPAVPLKVVILDARDFCSGATGRNGGHLTPNPFRDFAKTATRFGPAQALRSLAVERHTASALLELIAASALGDAVDLVAGGHIALLLSAQELRDAQADYAAASAAGADLAAVEWLSKEHMASHYGPPAPALRYSGHNLWPLKLATRLVALAAHLALALHTRTPVTAIARARPGAPRRWTLATPRGPVAAAYVVHATNAHASCLLPHLAGPTGIVPTRGQVVALRAAAVLPTCGWGANEGFEYWFARPVGRADAGRALVVLGGGREAAAGRGWGAYEEDDGAVDAGVGRALRAFLPAVFPGQFEAGREPEMEWSGIMGFTALGDPFVGPVVGPSGAGAGAYEGQYIAAGYSGHGMTRAFGCASVVADMIVADMSGDEWKMPEWLPEHFLTWNR